MVHFAAVIPVLKTLAVKGLEALGVGAAGAAGRRLGNAGRGQSAKPEQGTTLDDLARRAQEQWRRAEAAETRAKEATERAETAEALAREEAERADAAESMLADEQRLRRRLARVVLPISVVLAFIAGVLVGWLALSGL